MRKATAIVFGLILILTIGESIELGATRRLEGAERRLRYEIGAFVCWSDSDITSAKAELDSLFEIQRELTRRFQLPEIKDKIDVFVFDDENAWRKFWREKYPNKPLRDALFVDTRAIFSGKSSRFRIYLYLSPTVGDDLRHEGTHAILHAALRRTVPIWLDEGLAEYYEILGDRPRNPTWTNATRSRIETGRFSDLATLERLDESSFGGWDNYGDAWAWVAFFLNGPEKVRGVLPDYFRDLAAKKPFAASVPRRIDKIGVSKKDCVEYFNRPNRLVD